MKSFNIPSAIESSSGLSHNQSIKEINCLQFFYSFFKHFFEILIGANLGRATVFIKKIPYLCATSISNEILSISRFTNDFFPEISGCCQMKKGYEIPLKKKYETSETLNMDQLLNESVPHSAFTFHMKGENHRSIVSENVGSMWCHLPTKLVAKA